MQPTIRSHLVVISHGTLLRPVNGRRHWLATAEVGWSRVHFIYISSSVKIEFRMQRESLSTNIFWPMQTKRDFGFHPTFLYQKDTAESCFNSTIILLITSSSLVTTTSGIHFTTVSGNAIKTKSSSFPFSRFHFYLYDDYIVRSIPCLNQRMSEQIKVYTGFIVILFTYYVLRKCFIRLFVCTIHGTCWGTHAVRCTLLICGDHSATYF